MTTGDVLDAIAPAGSRAAWSFAPRRDVERYVVAPDAIDARHLLPWRLSSVPAASRRISDDRRPRQQARDAIAAAGLLCVGALRPVHRVAWSGASLIDEVASELGFSGARAIVMSGPPRANRKPVMQLHDRRGRTLAYVKVALNTLTRRLLDAEHSALTQLATREGDPFRIPPVLATGSRGDINWLAIGPIGVDHREAPTTASVDELARAIEATAPRWSGAPADAPFVQRLVADAAGLTHSAPAIERLLDRTGTLELVTAASHGDFVPWNILSGRPVPAVWDWERYSTDAPVGLDRLHHRLQVLFHRRGVPISEAAERIAADLPTALPELEPEQQAAHLDWYLAAMMCRYERDAREIHTPQIQSLITDLATLLKERTRWARTPRV